MGQYASKIVLFWFIAAVFWGCATVNWSDANSIAKFVGVGRDDFKKLTTYRGPELTEGFLYIKKTVFLRAWKDDRTSAIQYQIYAIDGYRGDWHFYDHAYDSSGNKMEFVPIDRQVVTCDGNWCWFQEEFGLNVSRNYLESHKASPIVFKSSGKGGEQTFSLPATYVQAFLSIVH